MAEPIIGLTKPEPEKADKRKMETEPEVSFPEGPAGESALIGEVAMEGEILAYQSLERIARMIALEIEGTVGNDRPRRIVFLQPALSEALHHHQVFVLATDHLQAVFGEIADRAQAAMDGLAGAGRTPMGEPITASLGVISATATALAGVAGLFREDVTIQGMRFSAPAEAFENSVGRALLRVMPGLELRNPRLLLYRPGQAAQLSHGGLLARLRGVEDVRIAAAAKVQTIGQRVLEIQFQLDPPKPANPAMGDEAVRLKQELIELKPVLNALSDLFAEADKRWQSLAASLGQAGSDDNPNSVASVLSSIQAGEELRATLQAGPNEASGSFLLAVRAVSLRANFKTRKGVLTNLGGNDSESYSGGAIATYTLLDASGQVRSCGTHRFRWPYLKFEEHNAEPGSGNSFDEEHRSLD